MTRAAHLVHGFNVRDNGAGSLDRLRPYLEARGLRVCEHDYGWRGLLGVRLANGRTAAALAACARACDTLVGHSNGADIIRRAVQRIAVARVVLVNPALDRDTPWPPGVEVHCWHAPSDAATWAARWLPLHPWGAMGRYGASAPGVRNHDLDALASSALGAPVECGHSGVWSESLLPLLGPRIAAVC